MRGNCGRSWALGALLTGTWATSAQAADCLDTFSPDRPSATTGHGTVAPGCAQYEGGIAVDRDPDRRSVVSFPSLFRFGLLDDLELRALTSVVAIDAPDQGAAEGLAPTAGFELKLTALDAANGAPGFGLLVGFGTAFNDEFGDRLTPFSSLLFDWEMVDDLWLAVNTGVAAVDIGRRERAFDASYAAVLSYFPTHWFGAFFNVFGGGDPEKRFDQWLGGVLAFYPVGHWQLDIRLDGAVTGDNPVSLQAGVATAF